MLLCLTPVGMGQNWATQRLLPPSHLNVEGFHAPADTSSPPRCFLGLPSHFPQRNQDPPRAAEALLQQQCPALSRGGAPPPCPGPSRAGPPGGAGGAVSAPPAAPQLPEASGARQCVKLRPLLSAALPAQPSPAQPSPARRTPACSPQRPARLGRPEPAMGKRAGLEEGAGAGGSPASAPLGSWEAVPSPVEPRVKEEKLGVGRGFRGFFGRAAGAECGRCSPPGRPRSPPERAAAHGMNRTAGKLGGREAPRCPRGAQRSARPCVTARLCGAASGIN